MLVLALDTTTRPGSLALARGGTILDTLVGDPAQTHAVHLPGDILRLLQRHALRLADVDVFAVASGPGSFTGLRIGIATIQGLAFANRRPVVPVSALDALVQVARGDDGRGDLVAPWMDAQRGEVFAALYEAPQLVLDPPVSEPPGTVLARWRSIVGDRPVRFAGDGTVRYRREIEDAGIGFTIVDPLPPLAPVIATLAAEAAARGEVVAPHAIKPVYVRRPDAELARDKRDRERGVAPAREPKP